MRVTAIPNTAGKERGVTLPQDRRQKPQRRSGANERQRTLAGWLFLLPALLLCAIFIVLPVLNIFTYSFYDWNGISSDKLFAGLSKYAGLTSTEGFWAMAKATLLYAIVVTVLVNITAFILALALDKKGKLRTNRSFVRALWIVPCLLSGAIVGIIWHIMYNYNNGLVNGILNALGLESVNWLETYGVTLIAVIVASVWAQIGLCSMIFLAGLQTIPTDLIEAADIDGVSASQKRRFLVIPLMASSITINVITTSIASFKAYELPFIISKGLPGYSTRLLTQRIYFYGFNVMDYGTASALSVVLIMIVVIISLIQLLVLRKREDIY